MRTANPTLKEATFTSLERGGEGAMTIQGTVNKALVLLGLVLLGASWTWKQFFLYEDAAQIMPWVLGGTIGGLVFALITSFKKTWAPLTGPIYAFLQGLALGGISSILELQYPGIVIQAVTLTLGILLALLAAYRSGMIRASENFKLGVAAATGGIFLVYMSTWVLGFFGISMPFIHESGIVGIGFSLVVVVVAALNLVLDFDFIESGETMQAPKYMEWYAAFGLMVTLLWLYIEILRLLAKLRNR